MTAKKLQGWHWRVKSMRSKRDLIFLAPVHGIMVSLLRGLDHELAPHAEILFQRRLPAE